MKKKILLVGGSSKLGLSIINKINQKEFDIFLTYNKKKVKNLKSSLLHQYKYDLSDLKNQKKKCSILKKNFMQ